MGVNLVIEVRLEIFLKKPLGGKHLSRGGGLFQNIHDPKAMHFGYFGQKTRFREENPSQGVFVTLPRRFRGRFREGFRPFFDVLHSFFIILQSSTGKYFKPSFSIHSMYPWWSTLGFMYFYSRFIHFLYPLLTCLSHFI